MGMIKAKQGEVLGLSLQAFDLNENLHPQAIIRDTSGNILTTLDLSHVGNGLYINRSYAMPAFSVVTAQYIVYSDAAHTTLTADYQYMLDVFMKEELLTSALISDGTILGIVETSEDDELVGIVSNIEDELIGVVAVDDDLIGIVEEDQLVGTIADDTLIGVVEVCS